MKDNPNLVIIDIRSEGEVKEGRIPKARWLDVHDREFRSKIMTLPKDKTYCLYCASGGRTSMVVPFMIDNGFSKVCDLEGGIFEWLSGGNPVEV